MSTTQNTQYMLWLDTEHNDFAKALAQASKHYHEKYGHWPTLVLAPQSWESAVNALKETWRKQGKSGVEIEIRKNVLPRHLMLTHQRRDNASDKSH
ncbi:hypothetical protein D6833_07180 [Candidatus Parcubacteria bacterium]|nr:MAG: hypothetical protein D6833_07180 [Candidatus Parcubacteria bacterium]